MPWYQDPAIQATIKDVLVSLLLLALALLGYDGVVVKPKTRSLEKRIRQLERSPFLAPPGDGADDEVIRRVVL